MRRRLSLACALVHRPAVLFLDEPTVASTRAARPVLGRTSAQLADGGTTIARLQPRHGRGRSVRRAAAVRAARSSPGASAPQIRERGRHRTISRPRSCGSAATARPRHERPPDGWRSAGGSPSIPARPAEPRPAVRRPDRDHRRCSAGHPRPGRAPRRAVAVVNAGRRRRASGSPWQIDARSRGRGSSSSRHRRRGRGPRRAGRRRDSSTSRSCSRADLVDRRARSASSRWASIRRRTAASLGELQQALTAGLLGVERVPPIERETIYGTGSSDPFVAVRAGARRLLLCTSSSSC